MPDIRCRAISFHYEEASQALKILGLGRESEIVLVSVDDEKTAELSELLGRVLDMQSGRSVDEPRY